MRIFQIVESLEFGGAERVVATLSNELTARHQITIVCLKCRGALAQTLRPEVRVLCLDKREGQDPAALWRLLKLMRRERPDVVHTHDWGVYLDAMLAVAVANVSTAVHTVHGLYMARAAGALPWTKRWLRHAMERGIARHRGQVVCVSDALRAHIADEIGISAERTRTLHNGIAVNPDPPAAADRRDGEIRFVTLGRLAAVKNFPLMIRAFAAAHALMPTLRLRIVGDGPERAALEALASSLGLADRVEFLGFRFDSEALLRDADAFLLSSISEGIPMSILEAMRNARPVISTRVGGVDTLVESGVTGLLVPSGDVDAYATALLRLASDAAMARTMGLAGHALVRRDFSIDAMVLGYERLYGQVS